MSARGPASPPRAWRALSSQFKRRIYECNLAPLCRHCHRKKQANGWRLIQTSPGHLEWTTPAGRRYTTGPTSYQ